MKTKQNKKIYRLTPSDLKIKVIRVKGCHDCPFHNNEWCNLGAGNVVNEWRAETYGVKCPLLQLNEVVVKT